MRVDRDAAAVVAHGYPIAGAELDLDPGRVAGDRLVHRIVEDFGCEMVQPALVGAADVHAGAAANRLQPLQNLDVLGGIAVAGFRGRRVEEIGHGANIWSAGVRASRMQYRMRARPQDLGQNFDETRRSAQLFGRCLAPPRGGPAEGTLADLADLRI